MDNLHTYKLILNSLRPFLVKGSINKTTAEYLKNHLHELFKVQTTLIMETGFDKITRVTINKRIPDNNNERLHLIKHLKNPPPENVTKLGRANFIEQGVLYATFDSITALSEMKPQLNDLITISTWELPTEKNLVITPIFMITSGNDNYSHNGLSLDFYKVYKKTLDAHSPEEQSLINELTRFVAECFAKEVEDGNSYDYVLSAWFADKYFNEFEGGIIEAIVYPSVKQKLGMSNIAIKPSAFNEKYKLIKVEESIVTGHPASNGAGYFLEGTAQANSFDFVTGTIKWD